MFKISSALLAKAFQANEFLAGKGPLIFVGIRGCLPAEPFNQEFRGSHEIRLAQLDYRHPRCTLVQWLPAQGRLACYPGSTVPNARFVSAARANRGDGANQLLPGRYADYRRGWHRNGTASGHLAWRQTGPRPILRTGDDLDYDGADRMEVENPTDNLHSAWCSTPDQEFSSAGCQVVVGLPRCQRRGSLPATGPWKVFQERGYAADQEDFLYALFDASEVARIAKGESIARVKFGSSGLRTMSVQRALSTIGIYQGRMDGHFGSRSILALIKFQRRELGVGSADGICGPRTAAALGLDWQI